MNTSNTPSGIIFDHVRGEVRYGEVLVTIPPPPDPPGPLNRAQFSLQNRKRGVWLGNLISDARYWLWRLSR